MNHATVACVTGAVGFPALLARLTRHVEGGTARGLRDCVLRSDRGGWVGWVEGQEVRGRRMRKGG